MKLGPLRVINFTFGIKVLQFSGLVTSPRDNLFIQTFSENWVSGVYRKLHFADVLMILPSPRLRHYVLQLHTLSLEEPTKGLLRVLEVGGTGNFGQVQFELPIFFLRGIFPERTSVGY